MKVVREVAAVRLLALNAEPGALATKRDSEVDGCASRRTSHSPSV